MTSLTKNPIRIFNDVFFEAFQGIRLEKIYYDSLIHLFQLVEDFDVEINGKRVNQEQPEKWKLQLRKALEWYLIFGIAPIILCVDCFYTPDIEEILQGVSNVYIKRNDKKMENQYFWVHNEPEKNKHTLVGGFKYDRSIMFYEFTESPFWNGTIRSMLTHHVGPYRELIFIEQIQIKKEEKRAYNSVFVEHPLPTREGLEIYKGLKGVYQEYVLNEHYSTGKPVMTSEEFKEGIYHKSKMRRKRRNDMTYLESSETARSITYDKMELNVTELRAKFERDLAMSMGNSLGFMLHNDSSRTLDDRRANNVENSAKILERAILSEMERFLKEVFRIVHEDLENPRLKITFHGTDLPREEHMDRIEKYFVAGALPSKKFSEVASGVLNIPMKSITKEQLIYANGIVKDERGNRVNTSKRK